MRGQRLVKVFYGLDEMRLAYDHVYMLWFFERNPLKPEIHHAPLYWISSWISSIL
jgi:hypothetical protein